jgi:dTDP-4-amino-4,6-dideoxygalactose transaminase/DNA-binding NarL/FixJ family response regulator
MQPATTLESRPAGAGTPDTGCTLGVSAEDPHLRRRIISVLCIEGLVGDPVIAPVQGDLQECLASPIEALIYAGEPTGDLARATLKAKQQCSTLRVVLVTGASRPGRRARHALGYGIDGVVDTADIETALASTVRAVLAGQAVAPGSQAADLVAPVLSHREKEVLSLLALGLANAEIAQRLFLARSTVKSHLTSAFGKLGVSSRREAGALVLDRETAVGRSLALPVQRARLDRRDARAHADTARSSVRRVPFVDLDRQHAPLAEELSLTFARVTQAGAFTLGEEVERFEAEFASYCEVAHCVGVASGTAALTLALSAAGVGPGDEIVVPAHTFIASALSVVHAGATPVLCDVEEDTGLLSVSSASSVLSERTAGIVAVHLYGQACDMAAIGGLAEHHGLAVFEDAAQAHGASFAGRRTGGLGNAAAFSFYPSKNLGALGDGGAICTDDPRIAEQARRLRNLGQRSKGEHLLPGVNERLDGLQAALLRVKLPHLDGWNIARAHAAERYREGLRHMVRMPACRPPATSVNHLFPIRVDARSALAESLAQAGVQTGVHYDRALHEHVALRHLPGMPARGELPAAEAWAREELSLPMFPELTAGEVDRVIATIGRVTDDAARR